PQCSARFPCSTLFRSVIAWALVDAGDRGDERRIGLRRRSLGSLLLLLGRLLAPRRRRGHFCSLLPLQNRPDGAGPLRTGNIARRDRKSTRLNSSHVKI